MELIHPAIAHGAKVGTHLYRRTNYRLTCSGVPIEPQPKFLKVRSKPVFSAKIRVFFGLELSFRTSPHTIYWAPIRAFRCVVTEVTRRGVNALRVGRVLLAALALLSVTSGCATAERETEPTYTPQTISIAVAPVLNLSGSRDWDVVKATDLVASELGTFPGVTVIPVNRSLALLAEHGKTSVDSPQDAEWLAEELAADGTVVAAITEYQPYDPPVVGLILQLYQRGSAKGGGAIDPVAASREATDVALAGASSSIGEHPLQIQRVFNAADPRVLKEMQKYAKEREGLESPFGWRVHAKSQVLYLRFSFWSAIRSMLWARAQCGTDAGLGAEEAGEE